MNFVTKPLSAGLYFVATPIGSARDMTLRGLDILASADVLAAEDTRTARKLMDIHGVPLVADPGYELGRAVIEADLHVTTAPGASAVIAALTVSGLPTDRFAFVGFLSSAKKQRETEIAELRDVPFTLVFYESPKRVREMLCDLRDVLGGERQAVVCRELTKKFEETQRGSLSELVDVFDGRTIKGEIVVLVGRSGATEVAALDVETALRDAMKTMRVKDAATVVAGALGLPRRQVYQLALGLGDDE